MTDGFEHRKKDIHIHTKYCGHATGEMEEYIQSGIAKGLEEIGFLAHAESGIDIGKRSWLTRKMLEHYWDEGCALKKKYSGKIRVSLGIELGINPDSTEELRALQKLRHWDYTGLSLHYVRLEKGKPHMNVATSEKRGPEDLKNIDLMELYKLYYSLLLKYIPVFQPDFICHLDVIRKGLPDLHHEQKNRELIQKILETLVQSDIALEVNTAGFDQTGEQYPRKWVLTEAKKMGVRMELNSDSHKPEDIGRHFEKTLKLLRDC